MGRVTPEGRAVSSGARVPASVIRDCPGNGCRPGGHRVGGGVIGEGAEGHEPPERAFDLRRATLVVPGKEVAPPGHATAATRADCHLSVPLQTPVAGMPERCTGRGAVRSFHFDSALLVGVPALRSTNLPWPSCEVSVPSVTATWPRVMT